MIRLIPLLGLLLLGTALYLDGGTPKKSSPCGQLPPNRLPCPDGLIWKCKCMPATLDVPPAWSCGCQKPG